MTDTTAPWPFEETIHAWWVEPGTFLAGEYPGHLEPDRARTKIEVLADAGIRSFVDLTTPRELEPYAEIVADVATERGVDLAHHPFPIPDLGVIDHAGYDAILDLISTEIARERPVFVHCWGGVGRTGTVVGSHLVRRGFTYDGAIERIEVLRTGTRKASRPSPETEQQKSVIRDRAALA